MEENFNEKLLVSQPSKKLPHFRVQNNLLQVPVVSHINPIGNLFLFFKIRFNITLPTRVRW
jgi:hypothetical protein